MSNKYLIPLTLAGGMVTGYGVQTCVEGHPEFGIFIVAESIVITFSGLALFASRALRHEPHKLVFVTPPSPTSVPQASPKQTPKLPPQPSQKRAPSDGVRYLKGPLSPVRGTFQLDQCVANAVGQAAENRGLVAVTTAAAGLIDAPDSKQLESARKNRRILITHDKGFVKMHKAGAAHAGIIIAPPGRVWHKEILRVCLQLSRTGVA